MSKNINFRARSKDEFETQLKPYPAVKQLPKWFLDMNPYNDPNPIYPSDGKLHFRKRFANATFKKCVPLLDGMSAGYIIPLWADVMVEQVIGVPEVYWKTKNDVFLLHGQSSREIPAPLGYDQIVYKYNNCWIPQTPKGYSCLITSPFGYGDLPFKAVPAIVDTDSSTLELVFPMWIKTGLDGIVEKGTPLIQIIPFKRDDWDSTFDYYQNGEYYDIIEEKNFNSTMVGHYLKNHHSKKKFK
jgi:hypothetical protein